MIRNYGLTELFSESSEPPFTQFPFADFTKLFPEGVYTFQGRDIDGQRLTSTFVLTHAIPDGPKITSPHDGGTLSPKGVAIEWRPVTTPAGIDVVAYEVLAIERGGNQTLAEVAFTVK